MRKIRLKVNIYIHNHIKNPYQPALEGTEHSFDSALCLGDGSRVKIDPEPMAGISELRMRIFFFRMAVLKLVIED
jgi:hypothetical protein